MTKPLDFDQTLFMAIFDATLASHGEDRETPDGIRRAVTEALGEYVYLLLHREIERLADLDDPSRFETELDVVSKYFRLDAVLLRQAIRRGPRCP